MRHKQQGMTLIGWIVVLTLVLVLALAAIRLVPVYLQYLRVADVIRATPLQMQNSNSTVTPTTIRAYIDKRFDIEAVTVINAKDVKITRQNDNFLVRAEYEHKVPYIANVNFVVDFSTEAKVRR